MLQQAFAELEDSHVDELEALLSITSSYLVGSFSSETLSSTALRLIEQVFPPNERVKFYCIKIQTVTLKMSAKYCGSFKIMLDGDSGRILVLHN